MTLNGTGVGVGSFPNQDSPDYRVLAIGSPCPAPPPQSTNIIVNGIVVPFSVCSNTTLKFFAALSPVQGFVYPSDTVQVDLAVVGSHLVALHINDNTPNWLYSFGGR